MMMYIFFSSDSFLLGTKFLDLQFIFDNFGVFFLQIFFDLVPFHLLQIVLHFHLLQLLSPIVQLFLLSLQCSSGQIPYLSSAFDTFVFGVVFFLEFLFVEIVSVLDFFELPNQHGTILNTFLLRSVSRLSLANFRSCISFIFCLYNPIVLFRLSSTLLNAYSI